MLLWLVSQVDDMLLDFELIIANLKVMKPAVTSDQHRELQLLRKRVDQEKASTHILVKRRRGLGPEGPAEVAPSSSRTVWKCTACSCAIYGPGCNKKPAHLKFCKDCLTDPSVMLGQRLFVYWPHDDDWYPGVVEAFHPLSKNFRVLYVCLHSLSMPVCAPEVSCLCAVL
jgi:hypothetical protein